MKTYACLMSLAAFFIADGTAFSGETIQISATHTFKPDDVQAAPVGDSPDHILMLVKSSGVNKSNGKMPFLDAATETEVIYADNNKGSGHHHGYIYYKTSDGTVLNEFDGYGTMVTIEGKDKSIGVGSWHTVSGTGRYTNGSGAGTYRTVLNIPAFDGNTEWDGYFTEGK